MTKEQQFNQEERQLTNAMDNEAATKTKLKEENKIMLDTLKEIAVPYPDNQSAEQDHILVKYLIATAQITIQRIEVNDLITKSQIQSELNLLTKKTNNL